jgi:hypothetical protein
MAFRYKRPLGAGGLVVACLLAIVLFGTLPDRFLPFLMIGVVGLLILVLPRIMWRGSPAYPPERASEMKFGRIRPLSAVFVAASFVWAIVLYDRRHREGVFVIPLIMSVVWLLSVVLPRISPRDPGSESLRRTGETGEVVSLGLLFLAGVARVGALGPSVRLVDVAAFGLGIILILSGNIMGKVRQNRFMGIRTPWTLASEEVWLRTQRVGGKVMIAGGALLIMADLAGALKQGLLPILASITVIPTAYSYFLHRRLSHL